MNANEVVEYIESHCVPSLERANVIAWVRSWEGPKLPTESKLVTGIVTACPHGSDPAHCWVCADVRRGNPDPTKVAGLPEPKLNRDALGVPIAKVCRHGHDAYTCPVCEDNRRTVKRSQEPDVI